MKTFIFRILLIVCCSSCAVLPKATLEMSVLMDNQITALEQSHLHLVNLYFDRREKSALDFLNNEWYPFYLNNFLEQETVVTIWNQSLSDSKTVDRVTKMKLITQVTQEAYMQMRDSILEPLTSGRKSMIELIEDEYRKTRAMNSAITNNVASVNKIQEKRNELLSKIVNRDELNGKIDDALLKADSVLNKIQKGLDILKAKETKIGGVINTIKN
jgi:hypothetical protein